jgi:hypothetical protein
VSAPDFPTANAAAAMIDTVTRRLLTPWFGSSDQMHTFGLDATSRCRASW